jgi:hypothetical protein
MLNLAVPGIVLLERLREAGDLNPGCVEQDGSGGGRALVKAQDEGGRHDMPQHSVRLVL